MLNFFDSIISFFEVVFSQVKNFLSSFILLLDLVNDAAPFLTRIFSFLPSFIGVSGFIFVALSVVKFILGR